MKIWAEWTVYVDRNEGDDWPDEWSPGYMRYLRPHKLTLTLRQKPEDMFPLLVRAQAICQKRWANSKRLTDSGTWYSHTAWEVDGPIPEWIRPYVAEALERIEGVRGLTLSASDETRRGLVPVGVPDAVDADSPRELAAKLRKKTEQ